MGDDCGHNLIDLAVPHSSSPCHQAWGNHDLSACGLAIRGPKGGPLIRMVAIHGPEEVIIEPIVMARLRTGSFADAAMRIGAITCELSASEVLGAE